MSSRSRIPVEDLAKIEAYINRSYPYALTIRETTQEFIDDPILVKGRKSVVSRKILEYDQEPTAEQAKLPLEEIQKLLFEWSEFLFKEHLIESPIWLEDDTEYNFGLNEDKPILKYSYFVRLLQKALAVSQTMVTLGKEQTNGPLKQPPELIEPEKDLSGLRVRIPGVTSSGSRQESGPSTETKEGESQGPEARQQYEQPQSVSISEKAHQLVTMSASLRRERLRIQESVIYAIAQQTGIDQKIIHEAMSEDVARVTGAIFNNLSSTELQDTLLNVTKKMNIYRDILRNTEVIAKTQLVLRNNKTKEGTTTFQQIADDIETRETKTTNTPEYQESVTTLAYSYAMDADEFETMLRDALQEGKGKGLSDIEITNIISKTKAYSLARKHLSSTLDLKDFLVPIVGEDGYELVTKLFGGEEEITRVLQIMVEKNQIEWNNRTQEKAILFSNTQVPQELVAEVQYLQKAFGDRVTGYATLLSRKDISLKREHIEKLMDSETDEQKLDYFRQELTVLVEAQKLQIALAQNVDYSINPNVRSTYTQFLQVPLSKDRGMLQLEQTALDEDFVFSVQNYDYYDTIVIPWEDLSEQPIIVRTYYIQEYPRQQQARWDSWRYRLSSLSEQRAANIGQQAQKFQKAISFAKKTQALYDFANKIKVLQVILSVISSIISFLWPLILGALLLISAALLINQISKLIAGTTNAATGEAAKSTISQTGTNLSNSLKSVGSHGKSLLSPAANPTIAAPATPFSLATLFSHLSAIAPGTVAAAGAVTSVAVTSLYMVNVQTSTFLSDRGNIPDILESKYVKVKKTAASEVPFDNDKTHHLPNEAVLESKPIQYSITISPNSPEGTTVALKNISFTDTTKITSRGPNYNDLIKPPVYDIVIYQGDQLVFTDKDPDFTNGEQYPTGTSDISLNPGEDYTIKYTLQTKPEYDDSLIENTVRVNATAEITGKDGSVTTSDEETGVSLTLRIGNPPALPSVQYAKSLAQAIFDNDPNQTTNMSIADVTIADFNNGLTEGLINDGFDVVVNTLRGSASRWGNLQCVGFAQALEQGMGFTLSGVGTAQDYATQSVSGYTFYPTGTSLPDPGDYVIMKGGSAGHIGMISEVNAASDPSAPFFYRVIDANWNTHGVVRGSNEIPESEPYASNLVVGGFLNYAGFLRRN